MSPQQLPRARQPPRPHHAPPPAPRRAQPPQPHRAEPPPEAAPPRRRARRRRSLVALAVLGALGLAALIAGALTARLTKDSARASGEAAVAHLSRPATAGEGPAALPGAAFPIQGTYHFGKLTVNRFQGQGSHMGQDVFAHCGTPLVAARSGRVRERGRQGAAGNFLTVDRADGRGDYVYMHLRRRPRPHHGDRVVAGQVVGEVGKTGDADGCHLHMEVWPRGRYQGRARNPLLELRRLARANPGRARRSSSAALGSE